MLLLKQHEHFAFELCNKYANENEFAAGGKCDLIMYGFFLYILSSFYHSNQYFKMEQKYAIGASPHRDYFTTPVISG